MKRLSKQKKQQLLLVVIGTVAVLAGLWFGVINWQQNRILKLAEDKQEALTKLNQMKETVHQADAIRSKLESQTARLREAESMMASGDLAWFMNTLRDFKTGYDVDIPQYGNVLKSETSLLPRFPYKQATLTVAGTAYYHDLGRFLADFENQFPYIRLQNLELEPARTAGAYTEKLTFRMDIVTLVKPET